MKLRRCWNLLLLVFLFVQGCVFIPTGYAAKPHKSLSGIELHIPFPTYTEDSKPSSPTVGDHILCTDTGNIYRCLSAGTWELYGVNKITTANGDALLGAFLSDYMSGCRAYRVDGDTIGVEPGEIMINGKLAVITTAITSTYTAPTAGNWLDVRLLLDGGISTPTIEIKDSGTTPGGTTTTATNSRLIASFQYLDGTTKISRRFLYLQKKVEYFGWLQGSGNAVTHEQVTFGVTFSNAVKVRVHVLGTKATTPESPGDLTYNLRSTGMTGYGSEPTATSSYLCVARVDGVMSTGYYWGYVADMEGHYTFS